jgi:DNA-directed RNA polymerase alpha subunit
MLDPIPELPDNTPISDVEFPASIRQVLSAASLKTVEEVREISDEALLTLPDFGKASISHLRETLGLSSAEGVRRGKKPTWEVGDAGRGGDCADTAGDRPHSRI